MHTLEQHWDEIRFGELKITTTEKEHEFEVSVYFNAISPKVVQVQLYANGINGEKPIVLKMDRDTKIIESDNGYTYKVSVPLERLVSDYTPRLIPNFIGLTVPLETNLILWQH